MRAMISRFAPAPTGFLHLGHVVNAIHVWGNARRILLRIEDHDRQRSRPEFEAAIVADLDWLGFTWDGPIVRQSARSDIYSQSLDRLRRSGLVYACNCSRAEIAADVARPFHGRAGGPKRPAPPYPGPWPDRRVDQRPAVDTR